MLILTHLVLHLVQRLGHNQRQVIERSHSILHELRRLGILIRPIERLVHLQQPIKGAGEVVVHIPYIIINHFCHSNLTLSYSPKRILDATEIVLDFILRHDHRLIFGVLNINAINLTYQ